MKKIFLGLVIMMIGTASFVTFKLYNDLNSAYSGPEIEFVIQPGEPFSRINYRLGEAGIISSTRVFHYYAKFKRQMSSLKTGTYLFKPGVTTKEVLEILHLGLSQLLSVTIPEGKNLYDIADILKQNEVINSSAEFIALAKQPRLLKEILGVRAERTEGYLYPDTYKFSPQTSAETVITTMLKNFQKNTSDLKLKHPSLTAHELVILASIVEKETGAKFERPRIAGVFHNRLKKRMRLQSDPTTIYGIYEKFDGNLRKRDLLEKTPYNTYVIKRLPIGPICNPGKEAIAAVLNPEQHDYLYFVSQNDGTHVFSKTYKEHSKAVDYWQKTRKNREGRSWRDLKQ